MLISKSFQSVRIHFSFAYLIICHIILKRVLPMYALENSEVEVFYFWVDRLEREYREPLLKVAEYVRTRKRL